LDNGNVQVWDLRKRDKVQTKIIAHQGLVLSVDWHPEDSSLVASGGRDGFVRVWNLNHPKQPVNTIQTISTVGRVSWRNGYKNHIATCANMMDFDVHVWDLNSKHIPYASLSGHKDVITGMLWINHNTQLVTCSQDSSVILHDLKNAYFPRQHVKTHIISWSSCLQNNFAYIAQSIDRSNPEYDQFLRSNKNKIDSSPKKENSFHFSRSINFYSTPNSINYINFNSFIIMAQKYRFNGDNVTNICKHNANVARFVGNLHIQHVWMIINSFVEDYSQFNLKEIEPNNEPIFNFLFG
jgi:WD repeat-containing protein 24